MAAKEAGTIAYEVLRDRMVQEQIESRGIRDRRLLKVMRDTPRHAFVPEDRRDSAYWDMPVPIEHGQTISQPYMVALMTELLRLTGDETVLDVGTGSGYQAAILAQLARRVVSIERIPELARTAAERLAALGFTNVEVVVADGSAGWPESAPYHAILVAAGAPDIPEPLVAQLAPGGRLVVPVGSGGTQVLTAVQTLPDGTRMTETHGPCVFVPLIGEHGWKH